MQQTFIKTIQGHTLEFNRILYPVRYSILSQAFESTGTMILVEKDEKGEWKIQSLETMPGWVSEITMGIYNAIEENEVGVGIL